MYQQPRASRHIAAFDWGHAQRFNAVKRLFARLQIIDGRRGRAGHSHGDMFRIVSQIAHARMCLETQSAWQVNGMRRDVVNGGLTVEAEPGEVRTLAEQAAVWREGGQR